MSSELSSKQDSEVIAGSYVDGVSFRCGGGFFVFLEYKGSVYPGNAKLLEFKDEKDISVVKVDIFYPKAPKDLVALVVEKRPQVLKLHVDSSIELEGRRLFYAHLQDSRLIKLTDKGQKLVFRDYES